MNVKKVLVADASVEFCDALAQTLDSSFTLQVCHDGLEVEALLQSYAPNVLVLDLTLPGLDGITLLGRICTRHKQPKILLTTCFISPYVEHAINSCGVDMVVVKPCDVNVVAERILDLSEMETGAKTLVLRPRTPISSMLMDLDIPAKRRGFLYLEMCIEMYTENPGLPLTKVIYPAVAKQYDAKADAVERAIRQVIHETWAHGDTSVWRKYFRCGRTGEVPRPTNGEFISRLAELQRQFLWEKAQ